MEIDYEVTVAARLVVVQPRVWPCLEKWTLILPTSEAIDRARKSQLGWSRLYSDGSKKSGKAACEIVCSTPDDNLQFDSVEKRLSDHTPIGRAPWN